MNACATCGTTLHRARSLAAPLQASGWMDVRFAEAVKSAGAASTSPDF